MLAFKGFIGAIFASVLLIPTFVVADTATSAGQTAAETWDMTYNNGDMDALGKLYTSDAQVIPKGAAISGQENITKFFAGLKSKGFTDHKINLQSATEKDKILILSGRWEMNGPGEGGAKKKFEGNWINVMERQGDGWRTILHTWN